MKTCSLIYVTATKIFEILQVQCQLLDKFLKPEMSDKVKEEIKVEEVEHIENLAAAALSGIPISV